VLHNARKTAFAVERSAPEKLIGILANPNGRGRDELTEAGPIGRRREVCPEKRAA